MGGGARVAATRARRRVTPERWAQIKAVVNAAMDLPIGDRRKYLDQACASDAELRREVESLLVAADASDSVPGAREAVAAARERFAAEGDFALRSVLERALGSQYEIVRPLGRGG